MSTALTHFARLSLLREPRHPHFNVFSQHPLILSPPRKQTWGNAVRTPRLAGCLPPSSGPGISAGPRGGRGGSSRGQGQLAGPRVRSQPHVPACTHSFLPPWAGPSVHRPGMTRARPVPSRSQPPARARAWVSVRVASPHGDPQGAVWREAKARCVIWSPCKVRRPFCS